MAEHPRRSGRSAGLLLADQVVNSLSNALLVVLFIRVLPPADLGRFSILLGVWIFVLSSFRAVYGQPLLIRRRVDGEDHRAAVETIALRYAAVSAVITLGCLAIPGLGDLVWLPIMFPLATGVALVQDASRYGAFSENRPDRALLSDVAWLLTQLALLAVLRIGTLTTDEVVFAWAIGAFVGAVVAPRAGPVLQAFRRGAGQSQRLWDIGRYIGIGSAFGMFTAALWPVVIASAGSFAIAGAYRAVDTMIQPVRVLGLALETDLLGGQYARRRRVVAVIFAGAISMAVAVVALGPTLSDLVFGSAIVADRVVLAAMFAGALFITATLWPRAELKRRGQTRLFAAVRSVGSVGFVVALAAGTAIGGLRGTAAGFAIMSAAEWSATLAIARRVNGRGRRGAPSDGLQPNEVDPQEAPPSEPVLDLTMAAPALDLTMAADEEPASRSRHLPPKRRVLASAAASLRNGYEAVAHDTTTDQPSSSRRGEIRALSVGSGPESATRPEPGQGSSKSDDARGCNGDAPAAVDDEDLDGDDLDDEGELDEGELGDYRRDDGDGSEVRDGDRDSNAQERLIRQHRTVLAYRQRKDELARDRLVPQANTAGLRSVDVAVIAITTMALAQPLRDIGLVRSFAALWVALLATKYLLDRLLTSSFHHLTARVPPVLPWVIAWAAFSVLWSLSPPVTGQRVFLLGATTVIAATGARRWGLAALPVVGATLFWMVALSVAAAFVAPGWARDDFAVVGIFAQKNEFGRIAALAGILALTTTRQPWARNAKVAVCIMAMLLANSITALTAFVACLVALPVLNRARAKYSSGNHGRDPGAIAASSATRRGRSGTSIRAKALLAMATFGGIALVATLPPDSPILSLLGRGAENDTLTLRRSLWRALIDTGLDRPVWGHGYGVSVVDEKLGSVEVNVGAYETTVEFSEAHNGFLEVFLQLGLIGGLLAFALLLQLWGATLRPSLRPAAANTTLQLTIIFQILISLTAAVLLNRGSLLIFILVLSFGIHQHLADPVADDGPKPRALT